MEISDPDEKKSRRTCLKCGECGHYIGDQEYRQGATSMTDAIKARYHSSGGDQSAASTILSEIAISLEEQARETSSESQVVVNNCFDNLIDEYNDSYDGSSCGAKDVSKFGQPSLE
jgi:hypothetical protein